MKEPFDPVRACFWLIASILAVHCVIVLGGLAFCVYWGGHIVESKFRCDNVSQQMSELMTAALAAALAFAGGFGKRD